MDNEYVIAHKHSIFHKSEILRSDICGYFQCLKVFQPSQIIEWTDQNLEAKEETALCPKCVIDSVIGSASGFPITKEYKSEKSWKQPSWVE